MGCRQGQRGGGENRADDRERHGPVLTGDMRQDLAMDSTDQTIGEVVEFQAQKVEFQAQKSQVIAQ
jgi:hypothetical protein